MSQIDRQAARYRRAFHLDVVVALAVFGRIDNWIRDITPGQRLSASSSDQKPDPTRRLGVVRCAREAALVQRLPILRASTSIGEVYDDPSEDALFMLFEDIASGHLKHFIVEMLADATGQTYAQTIQDGAGGWIVERREGSADAHFAATLPNLRSAHSVLTNWAFALDLADDAVWERLST